MSTKKKIPCLVLCVVLLFGIAAVPVAASGNWIGCAAPSYADWSNWQDWEEWEDLWKEWSEGKDWPNWQDWLEADGSNWPGWSYWWGWPYGTGWSQGWENWPDWKDGVPVYDDTNDTDAEPPYYHYDEMDDYNLYFGHLSAHTSLSNGKGSLNEAFRHARDDAGLDFFAVTDDSNLFDHAAEATLADGSASSGWTSGKATADAYTNSRFVGIFGYEMAWANGHGHINTYNTDGFETSNETAFKGSKGLENYYNALKKHPGSISQFNHPGKDYGDFDDFKYYDGQVDALVSLIEVGSGEGAVGSDKYFRSYDDYTRALDKGWHLAPTNNQDNRTANFGDANTARTVALAKKLTREELYDAMKNRRVYATEDEDLEIRYTLNGRIMGSIVNSTADQVHIRVNLKESDNETIGKVSVISDDGEIVKSQTLAVQSYTLDLTLPADRSYYYIRVDQFDKDIAVTAPVWVVKGDGGTGISRTYASTDDPIKGESLKITTELRNEEPYKMTVSSVLFIANGKVFKSLESPGTIKAGAMGRYTTDYTPPSAGKIRIEVVAAVTVNGVNQLYSDAMILDCSNQKKEDKKDKNNQKKDEAVRKVCDLINKINSQGTMISDSDVKAARKAYNKLSEAQKKQVDNYYKLVAAEKWKEWEDYWSKNKGHFNKGSFKSKKKF